MQIVRKGVIEVEKDMMWERFKAELKKFIWAIEQPLEAQLSTE